MSSRKYGKLATIFGNHTGKMWPTAIVRPATAGILYAYVSVKKYKYAIHKHLQTWSRVSVQGHMLVLLDGSSNPRNQKNPKMCEMLFKSIVILHWHETTRIQCGGRGLAGDELILGNPLTTWWFIPLTKWVITPVGSGFTLLIPVISGVITHLLSGMILQVGQYVRFFG